MSDCRAKDPLTCRYHGQEKLVDHLFDLNKRLLGWKRAEFTGNQGEESVRQIVFEMAMMEHPIQNVPALVETYRKRKMPGLEMIFNLETAVQEIAYQYDPTKSEIPEPNLLQVSDEASELRTRLDRIYAAFLLENGELNVGGYLSRHFAFEKCHIAAVHSINQRNIEGEYYTTLIYGQVSCACGRVKNQEYDARTTTEDLVAYVFERADKSGQ